MPRQRSPNRDKAYQLWRESDGTMLLKDIASQLGVSESQIRKWKNQDKWEQSGMVTLPNTKSNVTKPQAPVTAEEKSLVESVMANEALTEKQRLFCLYYVKCFNATKAYQKAYACSYETAGSAGFRMLQNVAIQTEIKRLKQNRLNQALLEPEDIFQKYLDIAFADMNDYMQIQNGMVLLKDSDTFDGSVIKKVSSGKVDTIELADRMRALDWLANHMDMATEEQRARIDKLKAETSKNNMSDRTIHVRMSKEVEEYAD
jgi:phage terminase small subunit